ncbi:hypothetical protein D623_10008643 [Myotis brandtii]|uniref:Uncharacterized protein n=1 Tax=Myotis brandtii TaxID=109478 RepID=S7Q395_MYOBR|nr:hypothetical protein D623_10008643 [Myotis brandtii]
MLKENPSAQHRPLRQSHHTDIRYGASGVQRCEKGCLHALYICQIHLPKHYLHRLSLFLKSPFLCSIHNKSKFKISHHMNLTPTQVCSPLRK